MSNVTKLPGFPPNGSPPLPAPPRTPAWPPHSRSPANEKWLLSSVLPGNGSQSPTLLAIAASADPQPARRGQLQLRDVSNRNLAAALKAQLSDPEREFVSDLCWNGSDGCAGDERLYDWQAKGYGIVRPVLFTARDGATLSGHVWATRAGPAKRPGS
jgi:hypothetical protein